MLQATEQQCAILNGVSNNCEDYTYMYDIFRKKEISGIVYFSTFYQI